MSMRSDKPVAPAMRALLASCLLFPFGILRADTVDLNSADAETLARALNGVGPSVAREIVAYREANGPFMSIEDLVLVRGIGVKLLERNRHVLVLSSAQGEAGPPAGRSERGTESPDSDREP